MTDDRYFDALETRSRARRAAVQLEQLNAQLALARREAPAMAEWLAGAPAQLASLDELAALPLLRKSDLVAVQAAAPPFGALATAGWGAIARVFSSPGPINEPQPAGADGWRTARALWAAGVRRGQLLHNTFSYHFTPAGAMIESGAHAIGAAVFPAGIGQSEQQLAAIAQLRPDGYVGTPSFLRALLDKAAQSGADVSSLRFGLVGGEALPPSLRASLAERGVSVLQCYATAELGLIAYESAADQGMVIDEGVVVEIVRPGTAEPVPAGEVGEVVVSLLANPIYPLLRFATGDLSKLIEGPSPCGRSNLRIAGWMGRADQSTKVRGLFVHPEQVAAVLAAVPEIERARLVVSAEDNRDQMLLRAESAGGGEALRERLVAALREQTKLRGEVVLEAPGALPRDGVVIEDARCYE